MKKHVAIATLVTMTLATSLMPAWSADTATDANLVKLQSASAQVLRQAAASAVGYEPESIEIQLASHRLTAIIVNSKQNGKASGEREREAIAMVSAIERGMAEKPEFKGVETIHIDYVSRVEKSVKTIQIFDFFRSPANAFILHKT